MRQTRPETSAESHNRNRHKSPKSQQTVKKHPKRPALPQSTAIKTPQTSINPPFFLTQNPSQPQINSNFHPYTPTHHIHRAPTMPWTPRNFKKRPNLHLLITALCLRTPNTWFTIL